MIPRGAAIFFAVGVFSAAALGLYLAQIANQVPVLVYQDGPSLTIIPDKISYHSTDLVHVRIINSGTVPLLFSDSSYGFRITGLDGTIIFAPISAQVISTLEPKDEKTFVWDKIKNDGTKVFEGRYKIVSSAKTESGNTLEKSVTINILK